QIIDHVIDLPSLLMRLPSDLSGDMEVRKQDGDCSGVNVSRQDASWNFLPAGVARRLGMEAMDAYHPAIALDGLELPIPVFLQDDALPKAAVALDVAAQGLDFWHRHDDLV